MADVAVVQPVVEKMDTEVVVEASAETTVKRATKAKAAKATPKAKAAPKTVKKTTSDLHPKYSQMIGEAIVALKERYGSSRQAILKYVKANYNVLQDDKVVNNHVKMSIRAGVKSGKLRQSKGFGACGSYKLGEKSTVKVSKPKVKAASTGLTKVKKPKQATTKKPKSPAKKSPSKVKKSAKNSFAKKGAKSAKKSPTSKAVKSPKKAAPKTTKTKKSPTKKQRKSTKTEAKTASQPTTAAVPADASASASQ